LKQISFRMKYLYFLLYLLWSTTFYSQGTIVLQPDAAAGKDARIFNLDALANYGSDPDFIASILNYNGEPGTTRSIIQFDLSGVPEGFDIVDARLSLWYNHESSTPGQLGDNAAVLRRLIQPWEENTVMWNQQPQYTTENEALIPASANSSQDHLFIDVTGLVRDMMSNPNTSFGFMFMLQDEQGEKAMKFYSSDGPVADKHPMLQITYGTVATSETTFENAVIQPNPFTDEFIIQNLQGKYSISIFDMNSRKLLSFDVDSNGNDLVISQAESLPAGIYLLKARGESGFYLSKIIKAK